ncbi:hypothetical protein AVEN_20577-1 [Araneus ventricosus]|uniref:Uncharacterized protein n=1 Tax=Araneus ventricosus TaxID=182803 RepID=A0A4Y2EFN5_ARAVE|nr:hypothetical protein AVEN_20577-1 [Araneus ventricosus]
MASVAVFCTGVRDARLVPRKSRGPQNPFDVHSSANCWRISDIRRDLIKSAIDGRNLFSAGQVKETVRLRIPFHLTVNSPRSSEQKKCAAIVSGGKEWASQLAGIYFYETSLFGFRVLRQICTMDWHFSSSNKENFEEEKLFFSTE